MRSLLHVICSFYILVHWSESTPNPDPLDTINIHFNLEERESEEAGGQGSDYFSSINNGNGNNGNGNGNNNIGCGNGNGNIGNNNGNANLGNSNGNNNLGSQNGNLNVGHVYAETSYIHVRWSSWGPWRDSRDPDVYIRYRTCSHPCLQCPGNSYEEKPKPTNSFLPPWENPAPTNCVGTCSQRKSYYRGCPSGKIGRLIESLSCPSGEMICKKCRCNVKSHYKKGKLIRQGLGEMLPDGSCSCNKYCGPNGCRPNSAAIRIVCCGDYNGPSSHRQAKLIKC